ncbi:hypothetical protein Pcinc_022569 [Petrolisthes cinctipes]|uniref:Uncharacterized protein n=1 Tax=Petrolisthes cinctipes TaxID=88211 RepID=A0AAE1FDY3_PETCI|nr:hypothetical protein Pcinc_022569 [Petrolisthes cinctipes]
MGGVAKILLVLSSFKEHAKNRQSQHQCQANPAFENVVLADPKMEMRNTLRGQAVGVPRWDHLEPPRGPHFSLDSPKLVKAAVGSPAHIPCKVRNLGSKSGVGLHRKSSTQVSNLKILRLNKKHLEKVFADAESSEKKCQFLQFGRN